MFWVRDLCKTSDACNFAPQENGRYHAAPKKGSVACQYPPDRYAALQRSNAQGHRLYLTSAEREAFRKATEQAPREVRTYCHTLLYTGCWPSEALALTAYRVDFQAQGIALEGKKK